jgi:hypothetical protein
MSEKDWLKKIFERQNEITPSPDAASALQMAGAQLRAVLSMLEKQGFVVKDGARYLLSEIGLKALRKESVKTATVSDALSTAAAVTGHPVADGRDTRPASDGAPAPPAKTKVKTKIKTKSKTKSKTKAKTTAKTKATTKAKTKAKTKAGTTKTVKADKSTAKKDPTAPKKDASASSGKTTSDACADRQRAPKPDDRQPGERRPYTRHDDLPGGKMRFNPPHEGSLTFVFFGLFNDIKRQLKRVPTLGECKERVQYENYNTLRGSYHRWRNQEK